MMRRAGWFCAFAVSLLLALPALSQDTRRVQSPVLTIETNRLYLESEYGRRIASEVDVANRELIAENTALEAELAQEEKDLTEKRSELEPVEFRDLADQFDEKVRRIRTEQETKARAIGARQDEARSGFLQVAAPVLQTMMSEAGAAVLLERSSVFVSLNAIDITRAAIERVDAKIGDGSEPADPAPQD